MMHRLHIGVIGLKGIPAIGGAAAVGQNIINNLNQKYKFTVYSLSNYIGSSPKDQICDQIIWQSSKTSGFNTFLYYIKSAFHALVFGNYDLIHLHHAESGFILPFLKIRYKVVVTFHGTFEKDDPKFSNHVNIFFRFSEYLNLKYANKLITVAEPSLVYLKSRLDREILHIPNGVGQTEIKNTPISGLLVFAAARIYSIKGLHLLIEALESIHFEGKLVVIGSFEHETEYKQRIVKMIRALNVEFIGLIKNKLELFKIIADAQVFVFPSTTEAMSMMLLEVASLMVPIVASDIPANRAIFSDDEITFFKNGDSKDLANKLLETFSHNLDIKTKSLRALEKIDKNFTWQQISFKYETIFDELMR